LSTEECWFLCRAKLEGVILSAVLAEKLYVGDLQGIVSAL